MSPELTAAVERLESALCGTPSSYRCPYCDTSDDLRLVLAALRDAIAERDRARAIAAALEAELAEERS